MQWIDQKYIGALAPRLQMFAKKDNDVWNMRCPICGDSRKSKTKARGYILGKGGSYVYTCHNCNVSMPFGKFLQTVDPAAYRDYLVERYIERGETSTEKIKEPSPDISRFITPKFIKYTALANLKKISQLDIDHPARKYVVKRQIPTKYHAKLFYAPKFKTWTNTLIPNKFDLSNKDHPRLIIPFVDSGGNLFGYQGRAFFDTHPPKYITIILNDEKPRVYGLESVNMSERVYVVEGPIDSMFIHNCIAMAGAHLDKTANDIGLKPSNTTIVYDNEPRNENIINAIAKVIDLGYNVCIWPDNVEHKDINEMISGGMTSRQIEKLIDQHTYRDLFAKIRLTQWKKI